jgi:hypothetical protein
VSSFLKKRSKKLLSVEGSFASAHRSADGHGCQEEKVFWFFFLKKEPLAFLARAFLFSATRLSSSPRAGLVDRDGIG